jgi:hypothetical protein
MYQSKMPLIDLGGGGSEENLYFLLCFDGLVLGTINMI